MYFEVIVFNVLLLSFSNVESQGRVDPMGPYYRKIFGW